MGVILIIGGRYQGKHEFAAGAFPGRRQRDLMDFYDSDSLDSFLEEDSVIIAEENSSGVVSADPGENLFREEYNKALIYIADRADEVYRVFCGIHKRIK